MNRRLIRKDIKGQIFLMTMIMTVVFALVQIIRPMFIQSYILFPRALMIGAVLTVTGYVLFRLNYLLCTFMIFREVKKAEEKTGDLFETQTFRRIAKDFYGSEDYLLVREYWAYEIWHRSDVSDISLVTDQKGRRQAALTLVGEEVPRLIRLQDPEESWAKLKQWQREGEH
ncbi:MAG: hypothetical protein IKD69_07090 [Solobacterium sp.]|nr:hypothetical protein [Solobacterium sp.]